MPRLLICNTHKTVDVLQDYNTAADMEAKHDHELREAVDRHLDKYGSNPDKHKAWLMRVEPDEWELLDEKRLKQAVFDDRLESYLKQERLQRIEDAMGCYNLHNRPTYGVGYGSGCPDYRTDSRRIGTGTGDNAVYLCDFCPYNSYVEHAKNKQVKFRGEK